MQSGKRLSETELWDTLERIIDETMLQRTFSLLVDGDEALRLVVAQRRLAAVHSASSNSTDPMTQNDFASRISSACSGGHSFALKPLEREKVRSQRTQGGAGSELAMSSSPSSRSRPLDCHSASLAEAHIVFGAHGIEEQASGAAQLLDLLRQLHSRQIGSPQTSVAQRIASDRDPKPSCLIIPYENDLSIAVADLGGKRLLAAVNSARLSSQGIEDLFALGAELR